MAVSVLKASVALGLFASLVGCGGGSTTAGGTSPVSGGPTPTPGTPTSSFDALSTTALGLVDDYVTENGVAISGLSRSTTVPTTGTATYNGYLYGVAGGTELIGTLTLDALFASESITGTADSFAASTGATVAGSLTGDGTLVPNAATVEPQATLVLRGTLSIGGQGQESTVALDGAFYADGADANGAIAGIAEGSIGSDFLQNGIFGAE